VIKEFQQQITAVSFPKVASNKIRETNTHYFPRCFSSASTNYPGSQNTGWFESHRQHWKEMKFYRSGKERTDFLDIT